MIDNIRDDNILNYRERCKAVFEQAPLAIVITDRQNNIIDWNDKAQEIFGWSKEEVISQSLNIIIPEEDYAKNTERIEKIFSGEKIENSIIKNLSKDGSNKYCEWNTKVIKDSQNNVIEIISIISDKTKVLEVEEKMKNQKEEIEYNQLRTQFFANISHELKTPLNLIFSSLQLIDFHFNNGNLQQKKDKIYKYLSSIKNNGYRLLRLVNNVIDITRIDVDSFNLSRGNFDIVKLCEAVVDSIEDYIQEKDRNFTYKTDIDKAIIAFDPFNIERVILNLISNSVKFTHPGDNITLKLSREADQIVISVIDTGIGIKKENHTVIFDQFRQVDQSFKKKREGSGIGLYLVKSIVEMHGGRVELESYFGEYTDFKIYLPAITIDQNTVEQESYSPASLLDKIEIEFSDIYNL
jgi:PAS domain S-box-containing protein